jgi:hypothetical protein
MIDVGIISLSNTQIRDAKRSPAPVRWTTST